MNSQLIRYITALFLLIVCSSPAQEQDTPMASRQDSINEIIRLQNQARAAIIRQDLGSVLTDLNTAHNMAEALKDVELEASCDNELAKFYYSVRQFDKASERVSAVIELLKDKESSAEIAEAYLVQAQIFMKDGDYTQATNSLDKAFTIYESREDESSMARIQLNKGLLALERKNPTSAVNYLEASLTTFQELNLGYYTAQAQLNKAKALLELSDSPNSTSAAQAEVALQAAVAISSENNYAQILTDSYLVSSQMQVEKGNFEAAYGLLQTYHERRDTQSDISSELLATDNQYRLDKGEYDEIIAELEANLERKDSSIKMNNFTSTLSIALITILSLLTLSLYKNNNLRAKANDLLQEKNSELQLAKERAEKASLAKAQFLSTITHELRTPLYAVTGLTHLLLEENPLEHQKEHLNSLKFSGDYLLSLINNILDLNKLEANKVEIERTTFNLKKRVNDVLVALKKSAEDKNNKLLLEFDESIPSKLLGDPLKISQILINLIGNSVKFTENGQVVLRVQKLSETENHVNLHFEVEDNGVGISKKKQKSIFETFSQGSLQINRKFGGTGLGLSIVKNLLQLMNSKIQLESQLGKGSKFYFDIRFAISDQFKEDKNPHNIIYDIDYVALENLSVLVVEDNKINQMITKKILEKNKMKCDVADNGETAIEMVTKNNYHIVLMDIHMPGISGIEATQRIREFNKELPIIALTAVTIDENLDEFYRAGFNEIIPKPFKTEEFFEKIHRTLFMNKTPV
ncbi:response regulator [Gilvibacter sp.]|uniref:tetratricopeptide repeat-containing hybrid sensor histidine kinase/response regulator n=1 Tax=Gilvibacter sp. TaxID=2729997 RepID=UPI0035BE4B5B